MGACDAFAMYACMRRGQQSGGSLRAKWRLIALSFLLNLLALLLVIYSRLGGNLVHVGSGLQDFVAFLRGIPFLLAVSLPDSRQESRMTMPIATAQVGLFAALSYFAVFFPGSVGGVRHTYTSLPMARLLLMEYALLAVSFSLRLMGRYTAERTIFYRSICVYLWAITAASYFASEIVDLRWNAPAGSPFYLAVDIALLGFGCYLFTAQPASQTAPANSWSTTLDFASPVLIPFSIFFLAIDVARTNFTLGMTAMAVSLGLFALRTTTLQLSYRRIQNQLVLENQLSRSEALIDQLTGIPNRRSFDHTLDREWRRAERARQPLGLLMIDIDYFKALNDTFGHLEGDQCLRRIAAILDSKLRRASDFLARYGGEEFAVVLTDASVEDIILLAESLRHAIVQAGLSNPGSPSGCVSVSIGVAWTQPSTLANAFELVGIADRALYQAKHNGRDRVEIPEHEAARMAFLQPRTA